MKPDAQDAEWNSAERTVVASFHAASDAELVANSLRSVVPAGAVRISAFQEYDQSQERAGWMRLLGFRRKSEARAVVSDLDRALGSTTVSVRVSRNEVDRVVAALEQQRPIQMECRIS